MIIPEKFCQVGNILMVHNPRGLIPKTIHKVMWHDAKRAGYTKKYVEGLDKEWPGIIYNHAEIFVHGDNKIGNPISLASAIEKGVKVRPISQVALPGTKKKFAVLVPKVPYSDWEKNHISDYAHNLDRNDVLYDVPSLGLYHVIAAYTGVWVGKLGKSAEKLMYCYEVASTCSNHSGRSMFEHPGYTNFWHLWLNQKYYLGWKSG
jgi:hypothetical protein